MKSLKDVVEVRFQTATARDGDTSNKKQSWTCPITNDILGPGSKAAYVVPCGHAFSGGAIKEITSTSEGEGVPNTCPRCDAPYASNDLIPILPTAATDIARLALRVKTLKEQGLTHALKKSSSEKASKKRKKLDDAATRTSSSTAIDSTKEKASQSGNGAIQNSATRALTDKVLAEQEAKKRRLAGNGNLSGLFSSRDQNKPVGKSADFMTRGFTIPADAKR